VAQDCFQLLGTPGEKYQVERQQAQKDQQRVARGGNLVDGLFKSDHHER